MDFTTAAQELAEGRCEYMQSCETGWLFSFNISRRLIRKDKEGNRPILDREILGAWQLVGVKPQMEEVEVVRWVLVKKETGDVGADLFDTEFSAEHACGGHQIVTKIAIPVQRPVRPKVKRREQISRCQGNQFRMINSKAVIPNGCIAFIEWEEETDQ